MTHEEKAFEGYWQDKGALGSEEGSDRRGSYRHHEEKSHGDSKPRSTLTDEPDATEASHMTYEAYRLWKHNQRKAKKL